MTLKILQKNKLFLCVGIFKGSPEISRDLLNVKGFLRISLIS